MGLALLEAIILILPKPCSNLISCSKKSEIHADIIFITLLAVVVHDQHYPIIRIKWPCVPVNNQEGSSEHLLLQECI